MATGYGYSRGIEITQEIQNGIFSPSDIIENHFPGDFLGKIVCQQYDFLKSYKKSAETAKLYFDSLNFVLSKNGLQTVEPTVFIKNIKFATNHTFSCEQNKILADKLSSILL